MSEQKTNEQEPKNIEESIIDRLEKNAVKMAMMQGQINQMNQIILELAKDNSQEVLDKYGIKLPE